MSIIIVNYKIHAIYDIQTSYPISPTSPPSPVSKFCAKFLVKEAIYYIAREKLNILADNKV